MIYCISLLDYIAAILLSLLRYVIIHIISFVHASLLVGKKKKILSEKSSWLSVRYDTVAFYCWR